jgi:subtilisin family serine protease
VGVRRVVFVLAALAAPVLVAGSVRGPVTAPDATVELVVTLAQPPLARLPRATVRLDLDAPASAAYLAQLRRDQNAVAARIAYAVPAARFRWRYSVTLNGLAVVVPSGETGRLPRVPGVARVWESTTYRAARTTTGTRAVIGPAVDAIHAPDLWGPAFDTAGNGIKIAIIDDGVDQAHPFFNPSGFTMPPGYPKGNTAYTTSKVIVARAFPPPSPSYANAAKPFDAKNSFHATHVAGIAAGDHGTRSPRGVVSGVAPNAYIGNYKALTIPTPDFALDGNAPEIAKAIDQAVADGMDIINMSLGEPEVEPAHDLVVKAIEGAAAAGVVPAIAAGNDFNDFGYGSVGSPGSAPAAITAGASTSSNAIAFFSSSGPTPVTLKLKPDVAAPGASILSSVPPGQWSELSGTSMASPHVAGAAALLVQRHPTWTVAQVKSALAQSATVLAGPVPRQGGGLIDLRQADVPLVFASPTSLSFGELHPAAAAVTQTVQLTDAGGGAGVWTPTVELRDGDGSQVLATPPSVTVPGTLQVSVAVPPGLSEGDHAGYVVLRKDSATRRIPFWFTISVPRLASEAHLTLRAPGTYKGTTRNKPALVSAYRYPSDPAGAGVPAQLPGPEQAYRVTIRAGVANFGVVVLSGRAAPRIVLAGDETRLAGYTALPIYLNPYTDRYGERVGTAAAVFPQPGQYDIVFDTRSATQAGPFSFRYWVDDRAPPLLALRTRVAAGATLKVHATDAGSGIDPASIFARVDGMKRAVRYSRTAARIGVAVSGLAPGRHTLAVTAADFQETKNNENQARILPNTRTLRTSFVVRR